MAITPKVQALVKSQSEALRLLKEGKTDEAVKALETVSADTEALSTEAAAADAQSEVVEKSQKETIETLTKSLADVTAKIESIQKSASISIWDDTLPKLIQQLTDSVKAIDSRVSTIESSEVLSKQKEGDNKNKIEKSSEGWAFFSGQ